MQLSIAATLKGFTFFQKPISCMILALPNTRRVHACVRAGRRRPQLGSRLRHSRCRTAVKISKWVFFSLF